MKIKALIVDDEKIIAESIQMALLNDGVITSISRANDGKSAFLKIKDHHHELIILDLNMPGLNGVDLIRKLKEIPSYKPTILIISGSVDGENIKELLSLGIKNILTKPFSTKEIVEKVKTLLPKS
ncbi:MAG: response regulator [Bdellovibrionota bacterium]|nr:response regulator [Bdellovibrionota bacterium]